VKVCVPSDEWYERHVEIVDAIRTRTELVELNQDVLKQRAQNAGHSVVGTALTSSSPLTSAGSSSAAVFMRPSAAQVHEQWARALVKKGLCMDLVDDPEFRKAVLMTARAGLSYVDAIKAESMLPHRTKMSTGHIPELACKLHSEMSKKIYGLIRETGAALCALLLY
jgi:hypothetical protein